MRYQATYARLSQSVLCVTHVSCCKSRLRPSTVGLARTATNRLLANCQEESIANVANTGLDHAFVVDAVI